MSQPSAKRSLHVHDHVPSRSRPPRRGSECHPGLSRQPGRVVRLVRLRGVQHLFRLAVLSRGQPDRAAAGHRRGVCRRLPHPAARRLAARPVRRPLRPQERAQPVRDHDGRRVLPHRRHPVLRNDRDGRSHPAGGGAAGAGVVGRWRVRDQRHLPVGGRHSGTAGILLQFPVRLDRPGSAARAGCADRAAAVAHRGPDVRLGLAGALLHRRGCLAGRALPAPDDGRVDALRG